MERVASVRLRQWKLDSTIAAVLKPWDLKNNNSQNNELKREREQLQERGIQVFLGEGK
jgi:hypothetical protein